MNKFLKFIIPIIFGTGILAPMVVLTTSCSKKSLEELNKDCPAFVGFLSIAVPIYVFPYTGSLSVDTGLLAIKENFNNKYDFDKTITYTSYPPDLYQPVDDSKKQKPFESKPYGYWDQGSFHDYSYRNASICVHVVGGRWQINIYLLNKLTNKREKFTP
jgi:hypothetical protein